MHTLHSPSAARPYSPPSSSGDALTSASASLGSPATASASASASAPASAPASALGSASALRPVPSSSPPASPSSRPGSPRSALSAASSSVSSVSSPRFFVPVALVRRGQIARLEIPLVLASPREELLLELVGDEPRRRLGRSPRHHAAGNPTTHPKKNPPITFSALNAARLNPYPNLEATAHASPSHPSSHSQCPSTAHRPWPPQKAEPRAILRRRLRARGQAHFAAPKGRHGHLHHFSEGTDRLHLVIEGVHERSRRGRRLGELADPHDTPNGSSATAHSHRSTRNASPDRSRRRGEQHCAGPVG